MLSYKKQHQVVQTSIQDNFISLKMGQPSLSVLPIKIMNKASKHFFAKNQPDYLQYGFMQGNPLVREQLSMFLTKHYKTKIFSKELFITYGATSAIDILCTLFTKAGDTIFIEDPTYFLVSSILKNHKLNVISIPTNHDGIDITLLEDALKKHKPTFIYTIPVFQNPSGITLSEAKRKKIMELSEKYNFHIIADEVYHLLKYKNEIPFPMCTFDKYEKVISLGSFSKILAPGLRLGWIQTKNKKFIDRIIASGMLLSGGGMNPFISGIVLSLFETGLMEKHLPFLIQEYSKRLSVLAKSLKKDLSNYVEFYEPNGGFYIWAKLKNNISSLKLEEIAKNFKVSFLSGKKCSVANNFDDHIRLSISHYESDKIKDGIKRLAKAFKKIS